MKKTTPIEQVPLLQLAFIYTEIWERAGQHGTLHDTPLASRNELFLQAAHGQVLVGVEMGNGHCFIMPQWLEMKVDNRYIHSGINILRVHLLPPTLFLSQFPHIFSLTASKVLCPWLCLTLNRFMRTFV